MVIEAEGRTAEAAENVEVGRFRGERERSCGERGFAVQPGAAHIRAEQEMGDGFQESLGEFSRYQELEIRAS